MPLRRPDPGSFEHLLQVVKVEADSLVRLSKYPKTEPWWSCGVYRFDGPHTGVPGSFGTCYTSDDLSVAFAESVIHDDAWFRGGNYQVPVAALTGRYVVRLRRPPACTQR